MFSSLRIVAHLIILTMMVLYGCVKTPEPPVPDNTANFDNCISPGSSSKFEIVTMNLQGFPKAGYPTIIQVRDLINRINPDVIAFQEIAYQADFNTLLEKLPGWEGRFYPVLNDVYNLAYIFKSSEVTIDDSKSGLILSGDINTFPRTPFEIYVKHKILNLGVYLINNHLKCCSGSDNEARRREAALQLDNYVKTHRPNDPVVILGDFNDEIDGLSSATNVFFNFVTESAEYRFADMSIAKGSLLWWSYPSYPSHIDHILVTNELFSRVDTTMVVKPDPCYSGYFTNISDHRPVELILK